ncbi:MAG: exodeoxyribonuclease III [Chloroflexota bacterium]|nr:exodeoxyribonuclease III [Chloroflexota bacterium]
MKMISWNVNGIRAAERKGFVNWLNEMSPDVMSVQETKAHPEQLSEDLTNLQGYHSYFSSAERKGYSGVATYTKSVPAKVDFGFGIDKFDNEGRILQLDYDDFVLFNIYFPNGKSRTERLEYKMEFYEAFLNHIDELHSAGRNILICGDVNTAHKPIDLARPKENEKISGFLPMEREWMDRLLGHGFVDTLRMFNDEPGQYSWWDNRGGARARNVGWRIDYFFVNEEFKDKVEAAYIMPEVMGSDHCPVVIELTL